MTLPPHSPGPPWFRASRARVFGGWVAALAARLGVRRGPRHETIDMSAAAVLDLFEEHAYVGEVTADGHYVDHTSGPAMPHFIGGDVPLGSDRGTLWESLIHPEDRPAYDDFNREMLLGRDAEVTYRLIGLDGVTRSVRDRGRPVRRADGSTLVRGIISDVTKREAADARARESAERFEGLLDVVGEHVYLAVVHNDGRVEELFQGPGADRLLGGAEPDAEMSNWEAAIHPDDRDAYDAFNLALGAGSSSDVEYRLIGADGITRWVHDRAATRRRDDGTVEISGIVSDVTERRRLEDTLRRSMADMELAHRELDAARRAAEQRARTDDLTGTYNRRHFAEIVAASAGATTGYGLLLLDADHFKQVNDRHGHAVGDAVLVELARRLQSELRADDLLARWGGEEFAVLLPGVPDDDVLRRRAEQLRRIVAATPVLAAGVSIELTISIGATGNAGGPAVMDDLIDAADRALYKAKRLGRDRVCLSAESLRDVA